MDRPANNPLTEEHYQCVCAVLGACPATEDLIRRCKAVGIDIGDREERLKRQKEFAQAVKQQFFPDRP